MKTNKVNQDYVKKTTVGKEVQNQNMIPCDSTDIIYYDKEYDEYVLYSEKPLLVFLRDKHDYEPLYRDYPFKYGIAYMQNTSITFKENGWLTKPGGLYLYNLWGNEGYSTQLPYDFNISETQYLNEKIH